MAKKVIIIGAGIAGLSAGIFLQREGIETQIFELSPQPGGVCASWYRHGYRFDGCMNLLVGIRAGNPMFNLFKESSALGDNTAIYRPKYLNVEYNGKKYEVPMEQLALKKFLISLSMSDAPQIETLSRDIARISQIRLEQRQFFSLSNFLDLIKFRRVFLYTIRKYAGKTAAEVVNSFKSDIIRNVLSRLVPGDYSAVILLSLLGALLNANAGYPLGGASEVVRRMEETYKSLGGQICVNAMVDEIIIAGGKAQGIRLKGAVHQADGIVAACDAYFTLKKMLRGRYHHPQLDVMLDSAPLTEPLALVAFGLDKKLGIPFYSVCECPQGFETAPGIKKFSFTVRSFDYDAGAAPKGGSSVVVSFEAPLDYWMHLRHENPNEYRILKELLAEEIAAQLDNRFPGFKDSIAAVDVATPASFIRRTMIYKGAVKGFAPTPAFLRVKIRRTVPGLKGFCLCGQWITASGIGPVIASGKQAAKIMKKEIRGRRRR